MKRIPWTFGSATILLAGALFFAGCEDIGSSHGDGGSATDTTAPPEVETPDLTGSWTMHRIPGTIESEDVCTLALVQQGNDVRGQAPGYFSAIYWPGTIKGTVAGTNVTFTWTYWSSGPSYFLEGVVGEDDEGNPLMEGTWTDASGGSGEWEAEAQGVSALTYL
jgi:hypothetical protein